MIRLNHTKMTQREAIRNMNFIAVAFLVLKIFLIGYLKYLKTIQNFIIHLKIMHNKEENTIFIGFK